MSDDWESPSELAEVQDNRCTAAAYDDDDDDDDDDDEEEEDKNLMKA